MKNPMVPYVLRAGVHLEDGPWVSTPTTIRKTLKCAVLVTVVSSSNSRVVPVDRESGQYCDGAFGQAPIGSLLTWPVA